MAVMIPDDVNQFSTDGERQFYGFLKTAAKPDSKYTAWYLPDINGREPDFILYCKDTGLTIFEVKDWSLLQIQEANPTHFIITLDGHPEKLENPLKQAKTYIIFKFPLQLCLIMQDIRNVRLSVNWLHHSTSNYCIFLHIHPT